MRKRKSNPIPFKVVDDRDDYCELRTSDRLAAAFIRDAGDGKAELVAVVHRLRGGAICEQLRIEKKVVENDHDRVRWIWSRSRENLELALRRSQAACNRARAAAETRRAATAGARA